MAGPAPAPAEIDRFRISIQRRLGLRFDAARLGLLEGILRRRAAARQRSPAAYLDGLETGARWTDEIGALARELTVGETYFFRNINQFRALREVVLPARARARAAERRLRILSAGCATGEEAYSLGIVAQEVPELAGFRVSIRGVDVNPAALERAAQARYSAWALRETPPEARERYFRAEGREQVLVPEIRAAVSFEQQNLVEAEWLSEPGGLDVIFCRNALMYFAPEAAREVVARFARWLAPGGCLFLGHAETLRGLSQAFGLRHTHETFYYERTGDAVPAGVDSGASPVVEPVAPPAWTDRGAARTPWFADIERAGSGRRAWWEKGRPSPSPWVKTNVERHRVTQQRHHHAGRRPRQERLDAGWTRQRPQRAGRRGLWRRGCRRALFD